MGAIKERPILFNSEMVRAEREDRKTQTRRAVKPQPEYRENESIPGHFGTFFHGWNLGHSAVTVKDVLKHCPFGQVGDRLWVRETFFCEDDWNFFYKADGNDRNLRVQCWKPSKHMPRWASRTLLEIVNIRIERVQGISTEDILAEGINQRFPKVNDQFTPTILKGAFIELWNSVTTKKSLKWKANPWV